MQDPEFSDRSCATTSHPKGRVVGSFRNIRREKVESITDRIHVCKLKDAANPGNQAGRVPGEKIIPNFTSFSVYCLFARFTEPIRKWRARDAVDIVHMAQSSEMLKRVDGESGEANKS